MTRPVLCFPPYGGSGRSGAEGVRTASPLFSAVFFNAYISICQKAISYINVYTFCHIFVKNGPLRIWKVLSGLLIMIDI